MPGQPNSPANVPPSEIRVQKKALFLGGEVCFGGVRLTSHNIIMKVENYPSQRKQIVETFHFPLDRECGTHGEKMTKRCYDFRRTFQMSQEKNLLSIILIVI